MTQPHNFEFLAGHDALLARLGALAERYLHDDPNTCLYKLRQFAEALAKRVAARTKLYEPGEKFVDLLNRLYDRQVLDAETSRLFHGLRKTGNNAVHEFDSNAREALHQLKMAWALAIWYYRLQIGDPTFLPNTFQPPAATVPNEAGLTSRLDAVQQELSETRHAASSAAAAASEHARLRAEAEALARTKADDLLALQAATKANEETLTAELQRLAAELEALQAAAAAAPAEEVKALRVQARDTGKNLVLDEADTRILIDRQLTDAGWKADSQDLTYAKGARPVKGYNMAIAEWPTATGPADYVLFAGLTPIAVVEAKRKNKSVSGALVQSQRYSRDLLVKGAEQLAKPRGAGADFPGWPATPGKNGEARHYKVPFLYSANGRDFLRQLETESGIWFLDARRLTNLPRPLTSWPTPQGLLDLLEADAEAAEARLRDEPTDYLKLRDYQLQAIKAVEGAISAGQRECLLAMATGTGKTKTVIGLLYRLLKSHRFRHILFLVDRESLGLQTQNVLKETRLEANRLFTEIYEVKEMGDATPEAETRVHVATVQGMVQRLFYRTDDTTVPIDRYDCIVVDESHRGYTLDRQMGDGEQAFRSLYDYVSTYRRVLDHFDAVKIGLTATPALHTREIFGDPVYTYSYREAVIDGYLIDHEPPFRLITNLAQHGIHFDKGAAVTTLTPVGESELAKLEDELDFDIEDFNRKVIAPKFTEVVCDELAKHLDPTSREKTLIFCVTDRHADQVVQQLKLAFAKQYGEVDNDAVMKITGAADKPLELIRRFKGEQLPNVVVTVDLLTTGIDVPEICNLVFLRRVKSRILYEQMLGRATRLCDKIGKEVFRVFDAVDLYAALEPFTAMKPLVRDVNIPLNQLVDELVHDKAVTVTGSDADKSHADDVLDQIIARIRRRVRKAAGKRTLSPEWTEALTAFETLTQGTLDAFPDRLKAMGSAPAADFFRGKPALLPILDRLFGAIAGGDNPVYIAEHDDAILTVEHGYGEGRLKPKDYLDAFGQFIATHLNEIPALIVVQQRPRDLTRAQLKELRLQLDSAGFREAALRSAWRDMTNQDIAASIIGHIRQKALGSPLVPYDERVDKALKRILASKPWTVPQRQWLEKIALQFKKEIIVDRVALDEGTFKTNGGFKRIDQVLDGTLTEVLERFGDAIWDDSAA